jgi:hypothetical protein
VSILTLHSADEERIVMEMARELDALGAGSSIRLPAGFTDRVMVAVASEALPHPMRAFGAALVTRRAGAALASIGDAWRVSAGRSVPMAVRAQALALVLVVMLGSLAVAGGAAAGAFGLLSPQPFVSPGATAPIPSEAPPSTAPTASTSPSPDPSPSAAPSPDPSPTADVGGSPKPAATPRATDRPRTATPRPTGSDDREDGSGSDGSGRGDGSGGGDHTPSPNPTESDGSDSGSDG